VGFQSWGGWKLVGGGEGGGLQGNRRGKLLVDPVLAENKRVSTDRGSKGGGKKFLKHSFALRGKKEVRFSSTSKSIM